MYLEAHYDRYAEGEIIVCDCSYPYFSALVSYSSLRNDPISESQPITCLIEDNDREIDNCPNCDSRLVDDIDEDYYEDEEDYYIPTACNGCSNYHGQIYNGNLLICAIHPNGLDNETCPDFTK